MTSHTIPTLAAVALLALAAPPAPAQEAPQEAPAALERLDPADTVLVLVDYTDGLYPIVDSMEVDEMLNNAVAMAKVAETFDIPIMVLGSEGGFYGAMHPAIRAFAGEGQPFERHTPSGWASGGMRAAIEATGRGTILIGGISTGNCTLLTSLDMLREGYDVRLISDISGADSQMAHEAALMRMRDAGGVTTAWISTASELLDDWNTDQGEALMAIYGEHMNGPSSTSYGSTANSTEIGGEAGQ